LRYHQHVRIPLALLVIATACGSTPPRTVVTSSAAEVSDTEGGRLEAPEPTVPEPPIEEVASEGASIRRGGDLIVSDPPTKSSGAGSSTFRRSVEGPPGAGQERVWVGIRVPAFVELTDGTRELTLLDPTSDGFLALYRDPVGASSCDADSGSNCSCTTVLYAPNGKKLWRYELDEVLPRAEGFEIRDLRYADGVLYINQSCTISNGDDCNRVVAIDTRTSKPLWRSSAGTSSHRLLIADQLLLATVATTVGGALISLSRKDGHTLQRLPLALSPAGLERAADGEVVVTGTQGKTIAWRLGQDDRLQPAPTQPLEVPPDKL